MVGLTTLECPETLNGARPYSSAQNPGSLMPLTAGTRLGHYEVRTQIGAGGMGEVYLAEEYVSPAELSVLYVGLGDKEQAFARSNEPMPHTTSRCNT